MRLMREAGMLTEHEAGRVIDAALDILDRMGVRVDNEFVAGKLTAAGGAVQGGVVKLSRSVMQAFLDDTERFEQPDAQVAVSACCEIYQGYYLDPATHGYRQWDEITLLSYVRLAKARGLPVSMLGMPASDWDPRLQPLTEKLFCWKWGINGGCAIWDLRMCGQIERLWRTWADLTGRDAAARFNGTVYLISPLMFAKEEAAQYEWFARRGLEVTVGSLGSLGGSAPVTAAGALALNLAEGLFLNFLRRAVFGHRDLHLGNSLSVMDMRSTAFQYGRPEQALLNIAGAAVARLLGAHYAPHGGLSDAKAPGYEAAAQKIASSLYNAHACGHGYIAAGLLAVDEVFSPEQLLLDCEAVAWLNRVNAGLEVNDDTLALEAVLEAGHAGEYLSREHTAAHFRDALFEPELFSRTSYAHWASAGSAQPSDVLREQTLAQMQAAPPVLPQLTPEQEDALWRIIREG